MLCVICVVVHGKRVPEERTKDEPLEQLQARWHHFLPFGFSMHRCEIAASIALARYATGGHKVQKVGAKELLAHASCSITKALS